MSKNLKALREWMFEHGGDYAIDYGLSSSSLSGYSFTYESEDDENEEVSKKLFDLLESLSNGEKQEFNESYY
jgi:hypothetical protein